MAGIACFFGCVLRHAPAAHSASAGRAGQGSAYDAITNFDDGSYGNSNSVPVVRFGHSTTGPRPL